MVEEIAKEVKVQILESDDIDTQPIKILKQISLFDLNDGLSEQLVG
jgi:hypothetical protein